MLENKIYIVLSETQTVLAKIIRKYTKFNYNHVSISLDKQLKYMYSFGRKNPTNPFIGGFVIESISQGFFARFPNSKIKVLELSVTAEQYKKLKDILNKFIYNPHIYKYNIKSILLGIINKKRNSYKINHFLCTEFVAYILDKSKIISFNKNYHDVQPLDFNNISDKNEIYEGLFKDYM